MITIGYSTRISNDEFKNHIIKTIGLPKDKFEIIEIINNGEFSLTQAYNRIINESKFNHIVFTHDDVIYETNNWGNKMLDLFKKNSDYGIIGIAGTTDLVNGKWWEIKESMCGVVKHQSEGKSWVSKYSEDQGNKLKEVVVLDGLFFMVDKRMLKATFDEEFDKFHFYDVSFTFENHIKGVKVGLTTKMKLTHKSIGRTNDDWEKNKLLFEDKFHKNLPVRLTDNKTFEEKIVFNKDSIGVGMVTYNAEDRIKQSSNTIPSWVKNFVIVNDGTPYAIESYNPNASIIQHDTNKCVGEAKNTAIKHLMEMGCEHIFIIEDDILIKDENVFETYVKHSVVSGIKHLNFALHGPANKKGSNGFSDLKDRVDNNNEPNPRQIIKYDNDVEIALYPNSVGAFSYYHRSVIEKIGFFDSAYKNAWEHVDHTLMAYKNGFHPAFWYFADINKSWEYLTDIPNSIQNSTISHTTTWHENSRKGLNWFKKKHGTTPMEIPLVPAASVNQQLQVLYNNR